MTASPADTRDGRLENQRVELLFDNEAARSQVARKQALISAGFPYARHGQTVASEAQRHMAEHDAWSVFGVDDVVNEIEVRA